MDTRQRNTTHTSTEARVDADKQHPEHDLACLYLSQKEQVLKLCSMLEPGKVEMELASVGHSSLEVPLRANHSKFIIGYADLMFFAHGQYGELGFEYLDSEHYSRWEPYAPLPRFAHRPVLRRQGWSCNALVEVKISRVTVGELLRQINLYRTAQQCSEITVVAALRYDIDKAYNAALRDAGVVPVRLGAAFDAWKANYTGQAQVCDL